jgi:hypothetical protein
MFAPAPDGSVVFPGSTRRGQPTAQAAAVGDSDLLMNWYRYGLSVRIHRPRILLQTRTGLPIPLLIRSGPTGTTGLSVRGRITAMARVLRLQAILATSFGSSAAAANIPPIIAPVIPALPTSCPVR